jgi:hypothetical protein
MNHVYFSDAVDAELTAIRLELNKRRVEAKHQNLQAKEAALWQAYKAILAAQSMRA